MAYTINKTTQTDLLNGTNTLIYKKTTTKTKDSKGKTKTVTNPETKFNFSNMATTLGSNKFFPKDSIRLYDRFTRFGYYNYISKEPVLREYLFFTKPDLNLLNSNGTALATKGYLAQGELDQSLEKIPYIRNAFMRNKAAIAQLQSSCTISGLSTSPFMNILTNSVTSKLDLPSISAESYETTANIMGGSMQFRSHSYKSDNGFLMILHLWKFIPWLKYMMNILN